MAFHIMRKRDEQGVMKLYTRDRLEDGERTRMHRDFRMCAVLWSLDLGDANLRLRICMCAVLWQLGPDDADLRLQICMCAGLWSLDSGDTDSRRQYIYMEHVTSRVKKPSRVENEPRDWFADVFIRCPGTMCTSANAQSRVSSWLHLFF